jgi:hypothetical protein
MIVGEGLESGGGGVKKKYNPTTPNNTPNTSMQERPRHKESTEIEFKLAEGALPQADYEGDGEFYVGRKANKNFKGVKCRGVVSNCDVCKESGGQIWEITYEDMDVEDVNHRELMDILVPDNRGGGGNKHETNQTPPRMCVSSQKDTFP